jgi:hypothetical protein
LVLRKANFVDRVPAFFFRVEFSMARPQKRFLLSGEEFDRWALLHITSWGTPSMGFKIFIFLEKCIAPVTVFWRMAFLNVVPRS